MTSVTERQDGPGILLPTHGKDVPIIHKPINPLSPMQPYNLHEATIVDVRSKIEFLMGHVPGSINIPLHKVPERVEEFRTMAQPIVLICASGNRSGQAAQFLQAEGLQQVYNGGGWRTVDRQLKAA